MMRKESRSTSGTHLKKESGKAKVAVIDDEVDVVTYLIWALRDNGFDVCSASNARDGLELLRSERPDLVCMDILMPRETGYSLYRKMKEDESLKKIPVLVITGMNVMNAPDNGLEPDGYIEKPVDVPLFIETVKELIG
jgi:CheY-like chemotaxis protein